MEKFARLAYNAKELTWIPNCESSSPTLEAQIHQLHFQSKQSKFSFPKTSMIRIGQYFYETTPQGVESFIMTTMQQITCLSRC